MKRAANSWRGLLAAAVLCAIAMAVPTTASAQYRVCGAAVDLSHPCGFVADDVHPYSGFQGWGYVRVGKDPNTCSDNGVCTTIGWVKTSTVPAWRWTGTWRATTLPDYESVYVYPFAAGWSWVWTSRAGWLAVQDANVWIPGPSLPQRF